MDSSLSMPSGTFLGPTQLFDKAWMIFEKKWKAMLIVGLPLLALIAIWMVFLLVFVGVGAGMAMSPNNPSVLAGLGAIGAILGVVVYLAFIAGSIWVQLAEIYLILNYDREVSFNECYSSTRKYILSFVWIGILSALIIMSGFMLLIIPGLLFAGWFIFAQFVVVDQGVRGLNALLTSREYVRGRWWGVVGRFLAFLLVYIVVLVLLGAVQGVIKESGFSAASALVGIVSGVVQIVFGLLMTLYIYAMYANLKAIKGTSIPIASGTRKKFGALAVLGIVAFGLAMIGPLMLLAVNPAGLLKVSRNSTRIADMTNLKKGIDAHFATAGTYPATLDLLVQEGVFQKLPVDPLTTQPYKYSVSPDGSDYRLCSHPEAIDGDKYKLPLDANGDLCVTAHSEEQPMMQYAPGAAGTQLEGEPPVNDTPGMNGESGGRMMRPQDYTPAPDSDDQVDPNRY